MLNSCAPCNRAQRVFSPCNTNTQFQILFNKHQGRAKLSQLPEKKRCMHPSYTTAPAKEDREGTDGGHDYIYLTPERLCKQEADSMCCLAGMLPGGTMITGWTARRK